MGATILDGCLPDGTYRFHAGGEDFGGMCMLGTFSERATISENSCIKVDPDLPLDKVVLIGCGVPTGFGSAVHAAATEPGDTIAIYGVGGIGINAVQGAALAGARNVVAIDPLANKREIAEQLGATHSCATAEQAQELISDLTRGVGADKAIVTVGVVTSEVVTNAFNAIRKGGTVVVTGLADPTKNTIELPGAGDQMMTVAELAEFLKVHPSTIYRMSSRKQIPHFRVGGVIRFLRSQVVDWLASDLNKEADTW